MVNVTFIGKTGHGKSTLINKLNGSDVVETSDGVESCTSNICGPFRIAGTELELYDTPGIADTDGSKKNTFYFN